MDASEGRTPAGEVSLASLLNILWRRRWLVLLPPILGLLAGIVYGMVVTPLYLATATVRPGITAFTPAGGGNREWRLKDITRWYETRLYREGVAERLAITPGQAPIIKAEFILRGLQNIQGGNVITLSTLDPDPQRARQVLQASIEAFSDYAMADTLSNSIVLTRNGLEIQIAERKRKQAELRTRAERLTLDIALARAESLQIDADAAEAVSVIQINKTKLSRIDAEKQTLQRRKRLLEEKLAEMERTLAASRDATGGRSTSPPPSVRPEAILTETEVYRALLTSSVDLQGRLYRLEARADSLDQVRRQIGLEVENLESRLEPDTRFKRAEVSRKMSELRIDRDQGIPAERRALDLEIRERRAQIASLSPIERVGSIMASAGPVRPRKQRATLILTFLGVIGGITLAFTWDYLSAHRREIFASER